MPAPSDWTHKSKTPPEAFRHIRRGVDQIQRYYYNIIIGLVHTKVKRKSVRMVHGRRIGETVSIFVARLWSHLSSSVDSQRDNAFQQPLGLFVEGFSVGPDPIQRPKRRGLVEVPRNRESHLHISPPNTSHLWTKVSSASHRGPLFRIHGLIVEPRRQECKEQSAKQRITPNTRVKGLPARIRGIRAIRGSKAWIPAFAGMTSFPYLCGFVSLCEAIPPGLGA